jgi:hypothetical protein
MPPERFEPTNRASERPLESGHLRPKTPKYFNFRCVPGLHVTYLEFAGCYVITARVNKWQYCSPVAVKYKLPSDSASHQLLENMQLIFVCNLNIRLKTGK